MIIQILNSSNESLCPKLHWFKQMCDELSALNEMEKLSWLHSEKYEIKCDLFLKTLKENTILIGYKPFIDFEQSETIRWIEIEIIGEINLDAITQVLLVTVGMGFIRSITGEFSTDWYDVIRVLDSGNKGYCCATTWEDLLPKFNQLNLGTKIRKPSKVVSSSMLLNQGLTIKANYEHAEKLCKTGYFVSNALDIMNFISLHELPKSNIFLFMSNEDNLYSINLADKVNHH